MHLLLLIIMLPFYVHAQYCPGNLGSVPICATGTGVTDPACVTVQTLLCRISKYNLPFTAQYSAKQCCMSFTKTFSKIYHPAGNQIFPNNAALGQEFDSFLKAIEQDPTFLVYFAKIRIILLHELYLYLAKIYASYNLTHVDTIEDYLAIEAKQALNRKRLIVNHLTMIIESQANQAFLSLFPTFPQNMASVAGPMMLNNDYGSELNVLLEQFEDMLLACPASKEIINQHVAGPNGMRNRYLTNFGKYLTFFRNYTQIISNQGPTQFVQYAQTIQNVINNVSPTPPTFGYNKTDEQLKQAIKDFRAMNRINPPIFHYSDHTLRAIKLIPAIGNLLPKNVQPVQWPAQLIKDASTNAVVKNKWGNPVSSMSCGQAIPVRSAFFTDKNNCQTTSVDQAEHLFVCIPTHQDLYIQQVISDPAWIDSPQGIILMLRACLGDFSVLLEDIMQQEDIIDPCMFCILQNAAKAAGLSFTFNQESCTKCNDFIKMLSQYKEYLPGSAEGFCPPSDQINGGPQPPPDNGSTPPPPTAIAKKEARRK